jgi:hypothetical protein
LGVIIALEMNNELSYVHFFLMILTNKHIPLIHPISFNSHPISVCWDDFNPEEIWATVPTPAHAPRRTKEPIRSNSGRLDDTTDRRPSSSGGGRWQRGLSIPTTSEQRPVIESDNPDDLWDDPSNSANGVGAASDFSAFGASLDDNLGRTGMNTFELEDMSKAAAAFEAELHGEEGDKGDKGEVEQYERAVDATRPLASSGTTIRSGSGDHVNVFEDFGEEEEEGETGGGLNEGETKEEEVGIKSGNEMSASSRLMKMIGVGGSGEAAMASGAEEDKTPAETTEDVVGEKQDAQVSAAAAAAASIPSNPWGAPASIPSNPWGDPVSSEPSGGFGSLLGTQPATRGDAAAQQQREEERRRQLQQEEEKKRWAEMQAKQQAEAQAQQQQQQQDQQMRQQQQNQVELVLIERISNILENSWGRTDLVSILTTLHADDSRVIAILANPDALRALIARHPQRIALVRDPAMGAEMTALVLTNHQWQMQQARLQHAQAQQAREQEMQRRRALEEQQQRQRLEAMAREREAQERQMQLQKQQQQQQAVITDAPWYYADPQGNIQVSLLAIMLYLLFHGCFTLV